jgi:hypothetical protein
MRAPRPGVAGPCPTAHRCGLDPNRGFVRLRPPACLPSRLGRNRTRFRPTPPAPLCDLAWPLRVDAPPTMEMAPRRAHGSDPGHAAAGRPPRSRAPRRLRPHPSRACSRGWATPLGTMSRRAGNSWSPGAALLRPSGESLPGPWAILSGQPEGAGQSLTARREIHRASATKRKTRGESLSSPLRGPVRRVNPHHPRSPLEHVSPGADAEEFTRAPRQAGFSRRSESARTALHSTAPDGTGGAFLIAGQGGAHGPGHSDRG